ncbi:amidinotransferase [Aeromicrobium sp.]|nr:amidinotransferase [Candidatus Saccharibacteria bacterium]
MSGVDHFDDSQPINPFMTQVVPIDRGDARHEHKRIREALESAGVTVIKVDPPENCQDGVYTANWALVRGDKAILASLPNARKAEESYAEQMLIDQGKTVIRVPEGLRASGQGDALPCGNLLFCGSTYRADIEAQAFIAEQLGYERIQLQTIPLLDEHGNSVTNLFSGWPDSFYYDIDLALSIIRPPVGDRKGLIAWCPAAFTTQSREFLHAFDGVDKIEVSEAEAREGFACNLVSTGETVIMNSGGRQLSKDLEAWGLQTILLDNPELGKGGGSIRCTTLTLNNS